MDKVAVVILNYLNYKDTIECIESLENDKYSNKEIIIVDNGSHNESWQVLSDKYKNSNIHLVKSEENLGFAKGNNLGIKYARNNLKCNYILLTNNDTIFKDNNMITSLINSYEEGIAVIGPRIISADNQEQNPILSVVTKEKINEEYDIMESFKHKFNESKIGKKIRNNKVMVSLKKLIKKENNIDVNKINVQDKTSEELILHGACMLLTKDYFKYYPELFPKTFLYYEENILTLITKKVNLKKRFVCNCFIYHKEDQSSKMSFNNLNNIRKKHLIESMKLCENLLDLGYEEILKEYF